MSDIPKKSMPVHMAQALASVRKDIEAFEEIYGPANEDDEDEDDLWDEELPPWDDPPKPNGQAKHSETEPPEDPETEPFETVQASIWHGQPVPETQWLDGRRLIPMESASFFVGATKIGKTYVALQASIACASGTPWMNEEIKRGPVLFYSAEENMEVLHARTAKICFAENMHLDALADLHFVDLSQLVDASLIQGNNRTGSAQPTLLYKRLDKTMALIKPVAVWLDNRGLVITGNENDRTIASSAMRAFQLLASKHKCAIIMIAHPSRSGENDGSGSSGSTAWFATGRSVLYMEKPENGEDDVRVVTNTLTNYGKVGTAINVKWDLDRYRCTDAPRRSGETIGIHDKAERVFLKLLRWHAGVGLEVAASKTAPTYAPLIFEAHKDNEKLNRKWFKMAMDNLLTRKAIEIAERGPPSKRVKFLREVQL
jgi:RecA-family ATPase